MTAGPRGTGAHVSRWSLDPLQAGRWEVYAQWYAYRRYASDAPFTVHYAGDTHTERVNQRANRNQWVSLGIFDFDAGTALVELSNDANSYVIADAIRFVYVGPP